MCEAVEGRLETLPSGGECISKRYMEFSHLCTVRDYLPTVDYCCCAHDELVLCCRYHQNWNHFRCNDDDDVLMMTYDQPRILLSISHINSSNCCNYYLLQ